MLISINKSYFRIQYTNSLPVLLPIAENESKAIVALHSTEALMAGFLKSGDLGPHPSHGYGAPHPHHSHHGPLPPGMPMTSLAPFGLPHGLDAVGFPQGMWGKYSIFLLNNPVVRRPPSNPPISTVYLYCANMRL